MMVIHRNDKFTSSSLISHVIILWRTKWSVIILWRTK